MGRKSKRMRGTSVVDIHAYKRRHNKPNPTEGKRWLGRAQIPDTKKYRTKAFDDEEDAWAWAEEMLGKMKLGIDHGRACTIRGLRQEYLEHLAGRNCSPGHVSQCEYVLGLALDAGINDLRDERLPAKVEIFIHSLKAQTKTKDGQVRRKTKLALSARTKNCYLNHLLALVSYAHKRRYLPFDPLHGVVQKVKGPKKLKPVYTPQEVELMLGNPALDEPFWIPFALTVYSGLRIGEAMHVEWQDIDWEAGRIRILVKPEYRLKNQKERTVLLPEGLADVLRPLAKPHGWIVDEDLRSHRSRWRHWYMRLLKQYDIEPAGRSPHSGRHTWACICSANGMDAFELKELAGHSSLQTTLGYCTLRRIHRSSISKLPRITIENHLLPSSEMRS